MNFVPKNGEIEIENLKILIKQGSVSSIEVDGHELRGVTNFTVLCGWDIGCVVNVQMVPLPPKEKEMAKP